jgi:glycosyltransferase involved in cell wall biosynthesis
VGLVQKLFRNNGFQLKIRVLHIITGLSVGGAEMMLYKLLSSMDKNQFNNIVFSLKPKAIIGKKIESLGIPVYYLRKRHPIIFLQSLISFIRISHRFRPNLIMGWMYHANLFAYLISCFLHKPEILAWNIRHSLSKLGYEKRFTRIIIRLCAFLSRKIPIIVFNSVISQQQHRIFGYSIEKSKFIANGFDTSLYKPSETKQSQFRKQLSIKDQEIFIGHIGRFHPMKDHLRFVDAAKVLSNRYSNVQFIMVGRGIDDNNLKIMNQLDKLGVRNRFHLLGERHDIDAILPSLDIFVSTSAWGEAFPNVIGEAMACGIPCVVTEVGDTPMIVGETGIIVPPNDTSAIVNGISAIIEMGDKHRRELGLQARIRITKKFGIAAITKQYETLFRSFA